LLNAPRNYWKLIYYLTVEELDEGTGT
jgi:hypothetical protein